MRPGVWCATTRTRSAVAPKRNIRLAASVTVSLDNNSTYITTVVQQVTTYPYDSSAKVLTVSNALGERTVTTFDPSGRPVSAQIYASNAVSPLRVTTTAYSADHHSMTV